LIIVMVLLPTGLGGTLAGLLRRRVGYG